MDEIVLVTSIIPRNLLNQKLAIESWIENGFHVISCNSKDEMLLLQDEFPEVEFVELHRDARESMGKPCPYIYDMLQVLKSRVKKVGGIINSDIHIRNFSCGMYNYLCQEAQDKVLFMRRYEVDNIQDAASFHTTMFFGGIDVFFLYKEAIDLIPDDGLILGQVMWDYWLPIMLKMNGVIIKELINPVAFHVRHPIQWDVGATDIIASQLCKKYFPQIPEEDATFYLKGRFMDVLSEVDLQTCYVTEKMKDSKVVVRTNDERNKFYDQTHNKTTIIGKDQFIPPDGKYLVEIPYHIVPSKVMLDLAIWMLEYYEWDSFRLAVYWRGNMSNALKIENCNQYMLENFNSNIVPISVSRIGNHVGVKKEKTGICCIYACSIYVEEDVNKLWNRYQLCGKIYIYPAGYVAQTWIKRFREQIKTIKLLGFVDQSDAMQKKEICGYHVFAPNVLENLGTFDKVVIISNMYENEIYQNLIRKVPIEKILIWNEFDGKKWEEEQKMWSNRLC